jgi:uncharacterized phage protein gp47/JayE
MTVGVLSTGFARPSADEIKTDLETRFRDTFGQTIRTDARSVFGQVIGILTALFDSQWERLEEVYHAFDPREATGAALEAICALTRTTRKAATFSTGVQYHTGNNGTALLVGDVVSSPDDALRYELTQDVTLATATAWAPSTALAVGAVRSNSGNCYYVVTAGTTAASGGPTGEDYAVLEDDGTVVWQFLGEGLAYGSASMQALSTGPVGGDSAQITKIGTPRAGWLGTCNPDDVAIGADQETDEALRVRRVAELAGNANATVDAIRAAFTKRSDVTECIVFENVENVDSADGLPPHSVEAVISGAISDTDAAAVLLDSVAAGIKTHGNTTVVTADGYGFNHTVKLTRPVALNVYCKVTVTADPRMWPRAVSATDAPLTVGEVDVRDAVVAYGATLTVGLNVRHTRVAAAVFSAAIPGTLGVSVQLDTVAITNQTPADVAVNLRQIGDLDASRTTVAVVFEDP